MEFLKEILGEELYASFSEKVTSYNTANPDKTVKIADLSSGAYVSKQKHDDALAEITGYKEQIANRDKKRNLHISANFFFIIHLIKIPYRAFRHHLRVVPFQVQACLQQGFLL